jgi:hypothetical protein
MKKYVEESQVLLELEWRESFVEEYHPVAEQIRDVS